MHSTMLSKCSVFKQCSDTYTQFTTPASIESGREKFKPTTKTQYNCIRVHTCTCTHKSKALISSRNHQKKTEMKNCNKAGHRLVTEAHRSTRGSLAVTRVLLGPWPSRNW